jgi:hypothetical protein
MMQFLIPNEQLQICLCMTETVNHKSEIVGSLLQIMDYIMFRFYLFLTINTHNYFFYFVQVLYMFILVLFFYFILVQNKRILVHIDGQK